ncbi:MAG: type II toxin-antitoxin system RelE/ParE family toxin [Thiotrichaceae bacterium]
MPYQVEFTETASKNLQHCPRKDQEMIFENIKKLAQNPSNKSNVKKLVNFAVAYRMRVGNYRILFEREDTLQIIDIIDILHRKDTYKRR